MSSDLQVVLCYNHVSFSSFFFFFNYVFLQVWHAFWMYISYIFPPQTEGYLEDSKSTKLKTAGL